MSTTIDNKVVEMRFDNKHFESNARETMSTLDKLKQKLNLSGASKGLENINTTANNMNMSGMSNALTSVTSKFSALQVMGVTALATITNAAVNAGMKITKSLTIDPIMTGFQEYETQLNAVQTIMANVGHKGKTLDDVNKALDELNEYADQTIYNFTEMTRNIGLFTNAGVDLDQSVAAIKGFSNAAAMAGTDATSTARAMYQLSQAMSSGSVRLMDWKSLETANITGERFQQTIKETAKAHNINVDEMIKKEGSFRETLKSGWLTADLMSEALNHYTLSRENMTEAEQEAAKAQMRTNGYTEEQIEKLFDLGTEANNAATKVKTFTQLWGVLTESAQSGWAKTWQIIIGDFEEAKAFFTPLANFLTGIIDKFNKARNELLEGALGKSFRGLKESITTVIKPIEKTIDSVKDASKALKDMNEMVNEVIRGSWGNGEDRLKSLTEAGYNYYKIQNKVNEKLGNSYRHSQELIDSQEKLISGQEKLTEEQKESNKTQIQLAETEEERIEQLANMSEAELEAIGCTEEQIKAFKELKKYSDMTGISINDFIKNIDKIDGRYLLIESLKNIGSSLVKVFESIGAAWRDAFPPMQADTLFNLIAAFHKFSLYIKNNVEKNAENLTRTLKGVFAILDIITMIVGGGFKLAFAVLKAVLGAFNYDILEFTAKIGDAIVGVRDWIEENSILADIVQTVATCIKTIIDRIRDWAANNETIINSVKKIKDELSGVGEGLKEWGKGFKETDNIPKYIAQGLVDGLKSAFKLVTAVVIELGKIIIESICAVLGIHSPSVEFREIGKNIVLGLAEGLAEGAGIIFNALGEIGKHCLEIFKGVDYKDVLSTGVLAGALYFSKRVFDIVDNITSPIKGVSKILESTSKTIEKFGKTFEIIGDVFKNISKGYKRQATANAMKSMAIAIGILAASIYLLSKVDPNRIWPCVGAIAALAAVLGVLSFALSKMDKFGSSSMAMIGLAITIGVMASALTKLSKIDSEKMNSAIKGLAAVVIGLGALLFAISSMPPMSMKNVLSIALLGLVVSGLATVIKMMSIFDTGACLEVSKALSLLLLSMASTLILLNFVGSSALMGIGALALLGLVVGELALILGIMSAFDINPSIETAKSLSVLLLAMSAALVILGVVGFMGPAAFIGIAAIATFVAAIAALLVGLGQIMQDPNLQSFLSTGIDTLIQLAEGLGEAIGAFIKGALIQISKSFPEIGANLSMFMVNLTPFIAGARTVDTNVLKGVGILAASVIALTAANFISSMYSLLPFVGSFSNLGTELSKFMINALPFVLLSKQIDPNATTGIKTLAEAIAILAGANIIETMNIFGGSSLEKFGSQLGNLADDLKTFVDKLGTFSQDQVTTITCAAQAIKVLAEAAKAIPNEGGLWGAICGENSLAKFGDELPILATHIRGFLNNLGTFTQEQVTTIDCAGKAIKALSESAKEIPNEGGLWGAICGENSLASFGEKLPGLGTNLKNFVVNLGEFSTKQIETVDCAGKAIAALAEAAKVVPNEGGLWSKIVGENSIASFGDKLPDLGKNLSDFVKNLGEFNTKQIGTVNSACAALTAIAKLGEIDMKDTTKRLDDFGDKIVDFAKKIKKFVKKFDDITGDEITSAIQKSKDVIEMARSSADVNVDSLKTFGESLKSFAKDAVKGFVKEFSDETPKKDAKEGVKAMVQAGIDGAEEKKDEVNTKFSEISGEAIKGLSNEEHKTNVTSAGKDLVQGLINGLTNTDKRNEVYNAAYSLGQLAVQGEKDGQQSNSPSKATEKAGKWLGEGLVIGIKQMGSKVYNAGSLMGEKATNSISNALDTALNLINSDMDANPTIRPVLDLSNVKSGMGYLGGMFNNGPSLAVATNLGAISSGMNSRNQNGTNNDVVSAINKLRKDLGNIGGDTYNVNGITYDDGSNITDAVKTLVRAANIERRR